MTNERKSPDTRHLKTYQEAQEYQLSEWVQGRPWHNPFDHDSTRHDGDKSRGECCPDFSCCEPNMMASKEARKAFAEAKDEDRMRLLFGFLAGLTSQIGDEEIYVAGDPDLEKSGSLQ